MQKWKNDPSLHSCPRDEEKKKKLNYYETYKKEFLDADPLRDWESIGRCVKLWSYFKEKVDIDIDRVLDCGTKDGQFAKWLQDVGYDSLGIEISEKYVKWAVDHKRPVIQADICNMPFQDNTFDVTFSHHVLGLTPDYKKSLQEMLRVVKPGGCLVTLNDCPGNPKKHYSYIKSPEEYREMLKECPNHIKIYFDYLNPKKNNEFVMILQKK